MRASVLIIAITCMNCSSLHVNSAVSKPLHCTFEGCGREQHASSARLDVGNLLWQRSSSKQTQQMQTPCWARQGWRLCNWGKWMGLMSLRQWPDMLCFVLSHR